MTGVVETSGDVAKAAIGSMSGSPLGIALLIVNLAFLGFIGYVLGEVAEGTKLRNETQMNLIGKLVTDIRDCRQGPNPPRFTEMDHLLPK
jgi:hypothetical protein